MRPGLSRMRRAMDELAFLPKLPPCLLIGGTNGKGSTAGFLARLLSLSGVSCGLYTSPHVLHFNERIQCTHHFVTMDELLEEMQTLKGTLSGDIYRELTFFELTTLLALQVFLKHRCEFLVMEVGMGGRFDATNVVEPIASCVVSVDYDHQEWLGNDLPQIMREKLGIARRGRPLFWGESRKSEDAKGLATAFAQEQREKAFHLRRQGNHFGLSGEKGFVTIDGILPIEYELPRWLDNKAPALKDNFALATAMFWEVLTLRNVPAKVGLRAIDAFDEQRGLWPPSFLGRSQILHVEGKDRSWDLHLDVCHNVASVQEFVRSLKLQRVICAGKRIPGLISILRDKDVRHMIELLREVIDPFMIFKIDHERSISEDVLPRDRDIVVFERFSHLWESVAKSLPSPMAVCGSFYAVGQVVDYFQAYPSAFAGENVLLGRAPTSFVSQRQAIDR